MGVVEMYKENYLNGFASSSSFTLANSLIGCYNPLKIAKITPFKNPVKQGG